MPHTTRHTAHSRVTPLAVVPVRVAPGRDTGLSRIVGYAKTRGRPTRVPSLHGGPHARPTRSGVAPRRHRGAVRAQSAEAPAEDHGDREEHALCVADRTLLVLARVSSWPYSASPRASPRQSIGPLKKGEQRIPAACGLAAGSHTKMLARNAVAAAPSRPCSTALSARS